VFWKVSDSSNLSDVLGKLLPAESPELELEWDDEEDYDYQGDFFATGVVDYDEAAYYIDAAEISTELPGLLQDAQMDLGEVTGRTTEAGPPRT
jgi:hypothetical protein